MKEDDRVEREAYQEIGKMLERARGSRSQKEFADLLGVDQRSVSNFEQGNLPRTARRIIEICVRAHIDPLRIRPLLFKAWGVEPLPVERKQLNDDERRLLDLYANEEEVRDFINAYLETFLSKRKKEAKRR